MKAHIIEEAGLKTVEMVFRDKTYNVAGTLGVLKKYNRLPEDVDEIDHVPKLITWLINDAVEREEMLTHEKGEKVTEELVERFIGVSNLKYYSEIIKTVLRVSLPESEESNDPDKPERVVTGEMIEMFGEPEEKNAVTE